MDSAPLNASCPTSHCQHLGDCIPATRRRADAGHAVEIVPAPKMDTPTLVAAVCTCGRYRSGSTSEPEARKAWRAHADAKTGYRPPQTVTRNPPPRPLTTSPEGDYGWAA